MSLVKHTFVIDDDPIILFLMKKLMQKTRFSERVGYFENSLLAIDALRNSYSPEDLYILFLDINMPQMDAWEFLKELHSFARVDNTNVFIITSSTNDDDEEKAAKDPFVRELIHKPILVSHLSHVKKIVPGWSVDSELA